MSSGSIIFLKEHVCSHTGSGKKMSSSLLETLLFGVLKQFLKSKAGISFHNKKLVSRVCTKKTVYLGGKISQSTLGS